MQRGRAGSPEGKHFALRENIPVSHGILRSTTGYHGKDGLLGLHVSNGEHHTDLQVAPQQQKLSCDATAVQQRGDGLSQGKVSAVATCELLPAGRGSE